MLQLLWNLFEESGQVSAYLFYKAIDLEEEPWSKEPVEVEDQKTASS